MRNLAVLICLLMLPFGAAAQEPTAISSFAESTYLGQYISDFDQVTVLVSDGDGFQQRSVEGNVRSTIFQAPEGTSQLEVVRNFEIALEGAGFAFLFNRPVLQKRFDTPEDAALRDWVTELGKINRPRTYPKDGVGTGKTQLDNIYTFPDHYLSGHPHQGRDRDRVCAHL